MPTLLTMISKESLLNIVRFSGLVLATLIAACGSTGPPTIATPKDVQAIVEATDLASAFEESEAHAIDLYNGKRARIHGLFARSEPLADGRIAMTFKTSIETFRPVRCIFDPVNSIALNEFNDGDQLAIIGAIEGFRDSKYFVTVEDCVVVDAKP